MKRTAAYCANTPPYHNSATRQVRAVAIEKSTALGLPLRDQEEPVGLSATHYLAAAAHDHKRDVIVHELLVNLSYNQDLICGSDFGSDKRIVKE